LGQSVWFVTPAWQRYGLSAACFAQRRRVIDDLAHHDIEGRCVVVADDGNLDIARELGFDVVEQNNDWLGRKFNDGMEYAAKNGADWIVPIGSDSWIHTNYFLPLPQKGETRTSFHYAAVTYEKLAELHIRDEKGAGPYMLHRDLLKHAGFRPSRDDIRKSVDRSTIRGIGQPINWRQQNLSPFQYIGFRGQPHITPYRVLWEKLGRREHDNPWAVLRAHYPADLVQMAEDALKPAP
jgi:hypothetical protein